MTSKLDEILEVVSFGDIDLDQAKSAIKELLRNILPTDCDCRTETLKRIAEL